MSESQQERTEKAEAENQRLRDIVYQVNKYASDALDGWDAVDQQKGLQKIKAISKKLNDA